MGLRLSARLVGALTKLMLSDIAVGAERLESFLWPLVIPQPSVKSVSSLPNSLSVCGPTAVNMINGEEMPIGFPTANALPAVSGHYLLSHILDVNDTLLAAGGTVLFGAWFLFAAGSTKSRLRQARSVTLSALSARLSALSAEACRVIARPTTIDTASFGCIALAYFGYILGLSCGHDSLYRAYADISSPTRAPEEASA